MLNQQVTISQEELDKLLNLPAVKFNLPITDQTYASFIGLVGKPNTRGRRVGVYVFTHIASGQMHVGSSNSLSRRLWQYFDKNNGFNNKTSGLLLPLMVKDGLSAFTFKIFVMPPEYSSEYYYLFLEQYFLLNKSFNLNTQRIVNFRVILGTNVYMYDLKCKTL